MGQKNPYQALQSVVQPYLSSEYRTNLQVFQNFRGYINNMTPMSKNSNFRKIFHALLDQVEEYYLCQMLGINEAQLKVIINTMSRFEALQAQVVKKQTKMNKLGKSVKRLQKENAEFRQQNAEETNKSNVLKLQVKKLENNFLNARSKQQSVYSDLEKVFASARHQVMPVEPPKMRVMCQGPVQGRKNHSDLCDSSINVQNVAKVQPSLSGFTHSKSSREVKPTLPLMPRSAVGRVSKTTMSTRKRCMRLRATRYTNNLSLYSAKKVVKLRD